MQGEKITIRSQDIVRYSNQYTLKMAEQPFAETIRIEPATGVYKKWASTVYENPNQLALSTFSA